MSVGFVWMLPCLGCMTSVHFICVGIIKHPGVLQVHTRCFVEHSVMDSDGKSLVLGSMITQSQKNYSVQVHVSAWNSRVSSQGAAVPMPANCRERRLLWLLSCHVRSGCCVLGFQCLQGRELEGLHTLAQELLSQLPCVCLEPRVDSSAALLGKETHSFLASTQ